MNRPGTVPSPQQTCHENHHRFRAHQPQPIRAIFRAPLWGRLGSILGHTCSPRISPSHVFPHLRVASPSLVLSGTSQTGCAVSFLYKGPGVKRLPSHDTRCCPGQDCFLVQNTPRITLSLGDPRNRLPSVA